MKSSAWLQFTSLAALGFAISATAIVLAQDEGIDGEQATKVPDLPPPPGATPLFKEGNYRAWTDAEQGVIFIDGVVSLRRGPLEMFACTKNTKEHESVVSANTQAFPIHAALLALGAEPGEPVQFHPEYVPPSGTEIEIKVEWIDDSGIKQSVQAQEWVRDLNTGKQMTHPWVFAGSLFWNDPNSGRQIYQAEGGDFICVSNFATAMLDIPVESTDANSGLYYEAFTERLPPLGTPVRLVLKPVLSEDAE
ncbi:MAG: YdjY domain-containing protein [Gammaproteobacteria bacterium]|nr:YdjY domain-containing protein [Gammaproteobacteria bacterium]